MLMLNKGIEFSGNAYDTHGIFSSEIKQYIDDLLSSKKQSGCKNLKEEISFERQQLQSSKKKTAMYKRNWLMFTGPDLGAGTAGTCPGPPHFRGPHRLT